MPQQDKRRLQAEGEERLRYFADRYRTHALFEVFDAHSEGDDIVFPDFRLPLLRQQQSGSEYLCLSDFVHPAKDILCMGVIIISCLFI